MLRAGQRPAEVYYYYDKKLELPPRRPLVIIIQAASRMLPPKISMIGCLEDCRFAGELASLQLMCIRATSALSLTLPQL